MESVMERVILLLLICIVKADASRPFPQPQISFSGAPVQGQPYSMKCACTRVCADPPYTLHGQWFKDSVELPETSVVLSFPQVRKQDEGAYSCRIHGGSPETVSPDSPLYHWVVMVTPQVHIKLATPDAVVKETTGTYLTLTCVATGALPSVPKDGYSWSYLPSPHGQLRPLVRNTSTLTLGPLTRKDSGQYFCQARNDQIFMKTYIPPGNASFTLSMSCIDDLLRSDNPSQALVEKDGDGYRAWFEIAQYQGLILIQHPNTYVINDWHPPCHFDVTLPFQHRVSNTSCDPCKRTLSFSLSNVTETDLGRYQCYVGTTHGTKRDSCCVELVSKVPPQVHIEPVTPGAVVMATAGKNLTLTCVVTEALPPVPKDGYSWSYLPSPKGQLRPLAGKTSTLTLGPLTREDSGQYFCQARNDPDNRWKLPPGNASITVDVSYLGRMTSTSDLQVKEGDYVTLPCSVDSNPPARLAWVVDGQEVRHVTAKVDHYVLERAACSDSKTYTCRASNPDLPGLERTASTTLTVFCGQADVSRDPLAAWISVTVLAAALSFTLAVIAVYLWRKQSRRRRSSQDTSQATPEEGEEASSQTRSCGQERKENSTPGSPASDTPLLPPTTSTCCLTQDCPACL